MTPKSAAALFKSDACVWVVHNLFAHVSHELLVEENREIERHII